jgi:hypothetical protein
MDGMHTLKPFASAINLSFKPLFADTPPATIVFSTPFSLASAKVFPTKTSVTESWKDAHKSFTLIYSPRWFALCAKLITALFKPENEKL